MEVLEEAKVFRLANFHLWPIEFWTLFHLLMLEKRRRRVGKQFEIEIQILPYRKQLSVNSNWNVFFRLCELLIENPIKFSLHVLLHNCSWVLLYKYCDAYKNFPLCVHRNLFFLRLRLFGLSFTFWFIRLRLCLLEKNQKH